MRGEQLAVHRADLVRQRLHVAGGDRQHRVEQAGQRDPLRLGDQLEVAAPASKARLPVRATLSLSSSLRNTTCCPSPPAVGLVGQLERVGAVPLRGDDGDDLGGDEPVDPQTRLQLFKLHV